MVISSFLFGCFEEEAGSGVLEGEFGVGVLFEGVDLSSEGVGGEGLERPFALFGVVSSSGFFGEFGGAFGHDGHEGVDFFFLGPDLVEFLLGFGLFGVERLDEFDVLGFGFLSLAEERVLLVFEVLFEGLDGELLSDDLAVIEFLFEVLFLLQEKLVFLPVLLDLEL